MNGTGVGSHRVDPFELLLSLVFAMLAAVNFFVPPRAGSSANLIPEPYRVVIYILIIVGALCVAVGMFSPRVWGYVVEQIGCLAVGWSLIIYALHTTLLLWQADMLRPSALTGSLMLFTLGVAYIWKRQRIWRDVKGLQIAENRVKAIKEGRLP